jgi:hypothetical protein
MTHVTTDQEEHPLIRLAYNMGVEVRYNIQSNNDNNDGDNNDNDNNDNDNNGDDNDNNDNNGDDINDDDNNDDDYNDNDNLKIDKTYSKSYSTTYFIEE